METASEGRLAFCKAVKLGARDNELCLSHFELGLDLATLGAIHCVEQLGTLS